MSELDRDVLDMGAEIAGSARDFYHRLWAEEIHPRHMEEVSVAVTSVLLFLFAVAVVSPTAVAAQASGSSFATVAAAQVR